MRILEIFTFESLSQEALEAIEPSLEKLGVVIDSFEVDYSSKQTVRVYLSAASGEYYSYQEITPEIDTLVVWENADGKVEITTGGGGVVDFWKALVAWGAEDTGEEE